METTPIKATTNPFERLNAFMEDMWQPGTLLRHAWSPLVDIKEDDQKYTLIAELPGLNRENLDVHVAGDLLIIEGKREQEKETTGEGFVRKERSYGSFYRSFRLESMVDAERIEAEYKEGLLTVTVPKANSAPPQRVAIK